MTTNELDLTADIIDVRDIIARIEELENNEPDSEDAKWAQCDEYAKLTDILEELKGSGGDEQWRGDWYPLTLIRDSYFVDYARELCEDIGDIPRNLASYIEIDWDATARNIRMDYSSIDIDGVTYWYR